MSRDLEKSEHLNQDHADSETHLALENTEEKSKSQIKREYLKTQQFVQTLLSAKRSQVEKLSLPDDLREEVLAAQSMTRGARKREIKFLSKRLHDIAPKLIAEFHALSRPHQDETRQFHLIESIRDNLLSSDPQLADTTLQNIINEHALEAQPLRQLIRKAKYELDNNKPPKSKRQLFKLLSQTITAKD